MTTTKEQRAEWLRLEQELLRGAEVVPGICDELLDALRPLCEHVEALEAERDEARDWVRRLTAEQRMLTCVYCGHAYPPGSPTHSADVLTAHVRVCEKHPMRELEAEVARLRRLEAFARHGNYCKAGGYENDVDLTIAPCTCGYEAEARAARKP